MHFALMVKTDSKGTEFCFAYLESIIIYSLMKDEHLSHIRQALNVS